MRLIRYTVSRDNKLLLAEVAHEHKLEGSFIADLYALLRRKGKGMPTEKRMKMLAKKAAKKSAGKVSETTAMILIRKRMQQLKAITSTAFFTSLVNRADSIEAARILVTSFQMLNKKVRQTQCLTCNLLKKCDFGQQYKDSVKDIGGALDPDYRQKVHPDCAALPDIDAANQLASAADAFTQMLQQNPAAAVSAKQGNVPELQEAIKQQAAQDEAEEPDPDEEDDEEELGDNVDESEEPPMYATTFDTTGKPIGGVSTGSYSAHHGGNNFKLFQKLIASLTVANLAVFDLGKKFSLALTAQKKGKYKPVPNVDQSSTSRQIESVADITKLQSAQHGLPEEVFDRKLSKKELIKQQNLQREDKKQLLYLVIDNSGSMGGWLGRNTNNIVSRGALASTLALSIIERVHQDKGIVFLRFFADGPSRLVEARADDEYERMKYYVANASYNAGGTNILAAIRAAVADIAQAKDEIASAEILCVTDCEDSFSVGDVQKVLQKQEFNVLDVSGAAFSSHGASGMLKQCATKYFKANEQGVSVQDIVNLI